MVDIYWVCGLKTNVGKTTVAAALVHVLNQRGVPALGFKPFAGGRLRDLVDFAMQHYPALPGRVFGSDGLQLTRASPLTRDDDVDLVSPRQLIYFRNDDDTLLLRTGSVALGNVEYFRPRLAEKLLGRSDIARLGRLMGLPFAQAQPFDAGPHQRGKLGPDAAGAAFAALLRREPRAVVVEGAGPFVPAWPGGPRVNHLVLVTDECVLLYPAIEFDFEPPGSAERHGLTSDLLSEMKLRGHSGFAAVHPIVEASARRGSLGQVLNALLDRARAA